MEAFGGDDWIRTNIIITKDQEDNHRTIAECLAPPTITTLLHPHKYIKKFKTLFGKFVRNRTQSKSFGDSCATITLQTCW